MSNSKDKTVESFILASQAKQVYYVQDPVDIDWHAVITPTVRDFYDMESVLNNVSPYVVEIM